MTFEAPHISAEMTVDADWIDYNGHMNMAYYNVLFDRSVDQAFELFGLGSDYAVRKRASFYTLEAHVTYLRELHAGDRVCVHLQLLDFDAKRTHFFQELRLIKGGHLSATCEQINMHVDLKAKRASPFPGPVLGRIAEMAGAHTELRRKPQVGHVISIPKSR